MSMTPAQRQTYRERKAKGLCVRCAKPALPGRVRCADCREYTRLWVQGLYDKRVLKGVCARCGKNPVSRFRTCRDCRTFKARVELAAPAAAAG
jgi:predicted amidophosphoribosyltransferase